MSLTLQLEPLIFPDGTEFPGTPQQLLELLAQYYSITGGETFNGVNYGATTPAAGDRDKPWYRLDNTDKAIGWHSWDGAAWSLLPPIYPEKTQVQVDALTPVAGQSVFNTTESRVEVYSGGAWKPAVPTVVRYHYDSSHIYKQHISLASTTAPVASWTALDLSSYITALGLDEEDAEGNPKYTIKAAIIRANVSIGPIAATVGTWDSVIRVGSDDTYSTTATDVLQARALMSSSASGQAAVAASIIGNVPTKTGTNNVYYDLTGSHPGTITGNVWLCGFIYTTTDAYFA